MYKGDYVTLFTDDLLAKMNLFRIDYQESIALRDSLQAQTIRLENLMEDLRLEIKSLRIESDTNKLLVTKKSEIIMIHEGSIESLTKKVKQLKTKTGLMGGVIIVLAVLTALLAI